MPAKILKPCPYCRIDFSTRKWREHVPKCTPQYDPKFPLFCGHCRSKMTIGAFERANGKCLVCYNGTVRDLTPAEAHVPKCPKRKK